MGAGVANVSDMNEWHKIETGPKDISDVLVYVDFGDGSSQILIMHWSPDEGRWAEWGDQSYDLDGSEITHWMPLPKPPE